MLVGWGLGCLGAVEDEGPMTGGGVGVRHSCAREVTDLVSDEVPVGIGTRRCMWDDYCQARSEEACARMREVIYDAHRHVAFSDLLRASASGICYLALR